MEQKKFIPVNRVFWLFSMLVALALLIPKMIQEGLFMDGMLYACVSRNLALGYGTFWFPKFNEVGIAGLPTFHEHPPLVFWMQSFYFRFFGDSYLVEKIYSFSMAVLTALMIVLNWRLLVKGKDKFRSMSWLPVLFWIIMPIIFFSYQNNLMENTMSVFSLVSVFFALKAFLNPGRAYGYLIISGISIFLASLSKGIPGFFTLAVVGIWWLVKKEISFKRMVVYSLVLTGVPLLIYAFLLYFSHDAYESLSNYLFKRALHRIENAHTVDSRFHVMGKLVVETLPTIIITVLVIAVEGISNFKRQLSGAYGKNLLFILLVALTGTVPLMLTLVQKSFYFIHALPFFALAYAMVSAPGISHWMEKLNPESPGFKLFRLITLAGLVTLLVYTGFQKGKMERDHTILHDVHLVGSVVSPWSVIGIDPAMHNNYMLHCYMVRYYNITLDASPHDAEYILHVKYMPVPADSSYGMLNLPLEEFSLYKKAD